MTSNHDLLAEAKAVFKLVSDGDRHIASQLLDSLDHDDLHQVVFMLVGAVQGSINGCFLLFEAVGPLLAQAGIPHALDAYIEGIKRGFDEALGTTFSTPTGAHHGA
ncbi:hypothetical protein MTX35_22140 [Rhodococcus sp. ARC_M12]|uniref:hypothetical protein n=1 Tax=Rhodococcus sp. ARC_M12 TaxID=2928854 RepID=UPI001FB28880|nr:hypothetical protein [Rhodococcus sp. ARC_M12]MCJ0980415.1 hypothetical protein [Rhodococcus sp. ARC_M12]